MKKLISVLLALTLLCACAGFACAEASDAKPVILVVSFGTSYNDSREATIGAIEADIAAAYPDYEVRRAFTAQTVIDILAERDGLGEDDVRVYHFEKQGRETQPTRVGLSDRETMAKLFA